MDLDLGRLKGSPATEESKRDSVRFEVDPNSFFTMLVFNGSLRDPQPGSMGLIGGPSAIFPEPLNSSANQLAIEKLPSDAHFGLVLRDGKTGFVFFNIEGHLYEYDAAGRSLSIKGGRLLISEEFANRLGRPADASAVVGEISIAANVQPIEVTTFVNGAVKSAVMPPRDARTPNAPQGGNVPGPDIIVGDMSGLQQFGSTTNPGRPGDRSDLVQQRKRALPFLSVAKSRPFCRLAKSLSDERRSEQQRALRANWPRLEQAYVRSRPGERLRLWLHRIPRRFRTWRGLL